LDFGDIKIELDEALANAWSASGSNRKGLEVDGKAVRCFLSSFT